MKKLLLITSSGGGGLLQAANAKEQETRLKYPHVVVVRRDIFKDWLGKSFGNWCVKRWNQAQINGSILSLKFYVACDRYIFSYMVWLPVFFGTLYTLFKEDVDHVIDTQPFGTSAVLKALRIYNYRRKKQLYLQKILVDLPTKAATHFFSPIKRLTKRDRPLLKLTAIAPLLDEGQTAEEFWQTHCRLSDKEICYEEMTVRQGFKKYQHKSKKWTDMSICIRYQSPEELRLIQKTCGKGKLKGALKKEGEIHFSIPAKAKLFTVLLGSQPASEATFNYMKQFVRIAKSVKAMKTPCYLFVFAAEHVPGQETLFRKIADYVERVKNYPSKLAIVPFSFQNDDVIAPLFYRGAASCTRSGGQTAMELMCVRSGEIWIHSEAKKDPFKKEPISSERLFAGIPGWEAASALYLQKICGAKVVTPETIDSLVRNLIE